MADGGHFEFPAVAKIARSRSGTTASLFGDFIGHLGCISEKNGSALKFPCHGHILRRFIGLIQI